MKLWSLLAASLAKSPALRTLMQRIRQGDSLFMEALSEMEKSILAAWIVRESGRSVLFVTSGTEGDRLYEILSQCIPDSLLELPAWDILPTEALEPAADLVGKRFETLAALRERVQPQLLILPIQALLQPVVAPALLRAHLHLWKKGGRVSLSRVPSLLIELGYRRVSRVQEKGEFALRGGIVDLFPISAADPYRIEWSGDEIDSLRLFDLVGQKSIERVEELFLAPALERPLLQKEAVSIASYFAEPPLLFWDDFLAIENRYSSMQSPQGMTSWISFQHFICALQPLEDLAPCTSDRGRTQFEWMGSPFHAIPCASPFRTVDREWMRSAASVLIVSSDEREEAAVRDQLEQMGIPSSAESLFERGSFPMGFSVPDAAFVFVVSGALTLRRQKWRGAHARSSVSDFIEFAVGDLVVHVYSGIGRYLGRETQTNHLGIETEFLVLEYAEKSKLYVPLSQAYLLSPYLGVGDETPPFSQLGSKRWQTTYQSAAKEIVGYAQELLKLYALRMVEGGFAYPPDGEEMQQFERAFPYTETEDQKTAIAAIKQDMQTARPMDRLVCGDVGYGKTEVAMRAAFKAVSDGGKQVALLVPTTVLALQHFETFSARMHAFGVSLALISRFQTAKETRETLLKVKEGLVDILIGTHRILSKDVTFHHLGLVLIDEEQRFGVRAKEHLKHFKKGVDCVTFSATPIPRTLYMSLVHARDLSLIQTPPQDRLPVRVVIAEGDFPLMQEALLREFARGGQAFYIHNRVDTIYHRAEQIHALVPQAKIAVVHGQMHAEEIDEIFHQFKRGDIDLLFATTLIENGVDVPNANTILVDRADHYGLADLYQLRGRVGRWNRTAYAYFLIPKDAPLSEIAKRRLQALAEAGGYGGGMKLAQRDLEIRGAGNLLGVQQSGQVSSIGFHLYSKLLKRAVEALKQKQPISFLETRMEFTYDARIPETYLEEFSLRMEMYSRLGAANSLAELAELLQEMKDRFGPPPKSLLWLYYLNRVRVLAAQKQVIFVKLIPPLLKLERSVKGKIEKLTFPWPDVRQPEELERYFLSIPFP